MGAHDRRPLSEEAQGIRSSLASLRSLFEEIRAGGGLPGFDTLSMGMSGDFELAIEEGATLVRVGTALFGTGPTMSRRTALTIVLVLLLAAVCGGMLGGQEHVPKPYSPDEFPPWLKEASYRAEVITVGSFPFALFLTLEVYDTWRM